MGVMLRGWVVLAVVLVAVPAWSGLPPPPECDGPTGTIIVTVGVTYTVTLTGSDASTQDLTVFDTGSLPPGATLTPPSGSSGPEPFEVDFEWTPQLSDAGSSYPIVIEFTNIVPLTGTCEFTLEVPLLASTTTTTTSTTATTSTTVTTNTSTTTSTTVPASTSTTTSTTVPASTSTTTSTTVTTNSSTTTTTIPTCGNGSVDPSEECDPPNGEICNNLDDDDADNLIDCDDPDCEPLEDPSCGADCLLVEPCEEIERDPATIRFDAAPNGLDAFRIHGRFSMRSDVDPTLEGFGVVLTNAFGTIYRAQLGSGLLVRRNGIYRFRDREARRSTSTGDGIYSVGLRVRKFEGVPYLVFRLRVYADLSAATDPLMTTGIVVGNDVASLTAEWTATVSGWRLDARNF